MKVNITQFPTTLEGYVNVNTTEHSITNLNGVCQDAECTEIIAQVLDYVHAHKLVPTLKGWVSKLRHGGVLVIGGTDILEVSRGVVNGTINIADANRAFFGAVDMGSYIKSSAFNCAEICTILKEIGLVVDKKRINGNEFVVEAHRD